MAPLAKLQTPRAPAPGRQVTFLVKRQADGMYSGTIVLPAPVAPVGVSTQGRNRKEALSRAAVLAKKIAHDPLLSTVLPPGTGLAVDKLVQLSQNPTAKKLASLVGPGAKRLGSALRKIF